MIDLNVVLLLGRLTRDPELRYMPSGSPICDFGLAVGRKWSKDGQMQKETSFFDVTAFGKTAELVSQYLSKGSQALIEGRLKQDRWQAKDGGNRSKVKVIVNRVTFIGGKPKREESADDYSPPVNQKQDGESSFVPDDDVPF